MHLVAIYDSRVPLRNDNILNGPLALAFGSTLTTRVWTLVYELVDRVSAGVNVKKKGQDEMESLKRKLVRELVRCVRWERDPELDPQGDAGMLVEALWPKVEEGGRGGERY